MRECPPDPLQIARSILDYLSRQQGAEDSLEGIMKDRFPEQPSDRDVNVVKEALGDLVTQGLLEKVRMNDRTVYRIKSRT